MKIGLYDSGVGGISVLHEAMKKLPAPDYLYLADEAHVPYGTKSTEEIQRYATEAVSFLQEQGAACVIVACNTASSAAIHMLRERFSMPLIGMEPAVKPAVERAKKMGGRVLVLATPFTVKGKLLHELIAKLQAEEIVDLKSMPRLVEFAEKGVFSGDDVEAYLQETLSETREKDYTTVVLGCTHFNYFLPSLQQYVSPETVFTDGRAGTVRRLAQVMDLPYPGETEGAGKDAWERVQWFTTGKAVSEPAEQARLKQYLERLEALYGTGE